VIEPKPVAMPKPVPVVEAKPKFVPNPDKPYSQGWERAILIRDEAGKAIGFKWEPITDEQAHYLYQL